MKELIGFLLTINEDKRPGTKLVLTCPLVLPVCMSVNLGMGRITKMNI